MTRKIALALWFLTLLALAVGASAQFTISLTNKTVTGTVSGVNGNKVFLFDDRLAVDVSNATIRSGYGAGSVASITAGTRIAAGISTTAADGTLIAATVDILPDQDASIEAQIDRIDWQARTLHIAGLTVRLTDATEARRAEDGARVPVTDLRPLQRVRLSLDRDESGLAAETIVFSASDAGTTRMSGGFVSAINGNLWTIGFGAGALVVRVTDDTFIGGNPRVRDRVQVTYRGDAAGDLVAVLILRISDIQEGDVAGEVQALSSNTITIDRGTGITTLRVDDSTVYRGQPEVGDLVVARTRGNVATHVEEIFATEDTFGFSGEVTSVKGNEWVVQGVTFYVVPNTRVSGSPQLGDRVNVMTINVNDRWYATTLDKL